MRFNAEYNVTEELRGGRDGQPGRMPPRMGAWQPERLRYGAAERFPERTRRMKPACAFRDRHECPSRSGARDSGTRPAVRAWNVYNYLHGYTFMRTNIVIDDKLMRDTLRATGLKTKREAVEEALRTLPRLRRQEGIRRLRGKLDWQGDLNAMRSDR